MVKYYGATIEYLRKFFGGDFTVTEATIAVGAAQIRIAPGDAERISLTFINLGATTIFIAPTVQVAADRGIRLAANGGTVAMNLFQDTLLPAVEWYAIGDAGGGTLYRIGVQRGTLIEAEGE